DAPAHADHGGQRYYFCSDKCHTKFTERPTQYAGGQPAAGVDADESKGTGSSEGGTGATVTDPVCGMAVEPATGAGHATYAGVDYAFCSTGCQEAFTANPARYLSASEAR
ncbi:MAG: YHS domain-containing protein, partial [Mycobacteriaceae bacterium]